MTNRDGMLLVIRGFGLYLLCHALFAPPTMVGLLTLGLATNEVQLNTSGTFSIASHVKADILSKLGLTMTQLIFCGGAGLYLLRARAALRWLRIPELAEQPSD